MNKIKDIKKERIDLTDLLIHFTRNNGELTSFEVLKKIISDGYLTPGWSFRSSRRTVFGTNPAVCFTETPLYGFIDYVNKRKNKYAVDSYGIAILKTDLFRLSARPVIYGTTKNLVEKKHPDGSYEIVGFPPEEQYRYILTSVDEINDWMHEREWRWANWCAVTSENGELPLWTISHPGTQPGHDLYFHYDAIVIIVKNLMGKRLVAKMIQDKYNVVKLELEHNKNEDFVPSLNYGNLKNTFVLNLDDCDFNTNPHYKLEDAFKDRTIEKIIAE